MRLLTWLSATSMFVLAGWPSASLADGTVNVHTVQPGESVRGIAEANGVTSDTILAANTDDRSRPLAGRAAAGRPIG